jgi:hypothetical protein
MSLAIGQCTRKGRMAGTHTGHANHAMGRDYHRSLPRSGPARRTGRNYQRATYPGSYVIEFVWGLGHWEVLKGVT